MTIGDTVELVHPAGNNLPVDSGKERQQPSENDKSIIKEELFEDLSADKESNEEED